jgi:hypothetical protein
MRFGIVTHTAGAKVLDLARELIAYVVPKVNARYSHIDLDWGFAIRCLPETQRYKSFTRYMKKTNELTIDVYFCLEEYRSMYKAEQRFHLGNTFMEYLRIAFEKRKFDGLDSDELIEYIMTLGREMNPSWFDEEMDWTSDLDE